MEFTGALALAAWIGVGVFVCGGFLLPMARSAPAYDKIYHQERNGKYFIYQHPDGQYHTENWTDNAAIATGAFRWFDPNGLETAIEFIADDRGYRILKKRRTFSIPRFSRSDPEGPPGIEEDPSDADHSEIVNSFAYTTDNSFRVEQKRKSGIVYGKYGFLDGQGRLHIVYYTAHADHGFLAQREVYDPKRRAVPALNDAFTLPLRDIASEKGLRAVFRSKKNAS